MGGEYDVSNAGALWCRVAAVIDVDDADVVLHLGQVTFLDASIITVFIRAKTRLDREGRSFSLQSLSPCAVRIVELCGLACLVEGDIGTKRKS